MYNIVSHPNLKLYRTCQKRGISIPRVMPNDSFSALTCYLHRLFVCTFENGIQTSSHPTTLLRQGWLATGKQAHNARKAKDNGHIWLKRDSELVKIIKEQAREESKACKAFDFLSFHLMARIILEFLPMKIFLIR